MGGTGDFRLLGDMLKGVDLTANRIVADLH